MADDLPRSITAGLYPVEIAGETTFAWSHPLATINLRTLDRSTPWTCAFVARAARPADVPQPRVTIGVDGVNAVTTTPGNEFEPIEVTVPPRRARGVTLTISTNPSYVPGPGDPRALGVQIDRVSCTPGRGWIVPARAVVVAAATAGALLGLVFAALLATRTSIIGAVALFALGTALLLTTSPASYVGSYLWWWTPVAVWIAVPLLVLRSTRPRLSRATGLVLAFSAAVLCLKILALLHPAKDVVDAVFHARRLAWVLDGRFLFTQPMPGGVQFPYAIGLYVSAAPLASLVSDHVALLRIVVSVSETLAALALYGAVVRSGGDRRVAVLSAVVYHLVPLPYVVIGNANLTFAFGQSIAVIAGAGALALGRGTAHLGWLVPLFIATTLAYLSHVAVFPLLAVTLVLFSALCWRVGDVGARRAARGIAGVAVLAAAVAIGSYYAHFPEVWGTLDRVSAAQPSPDRAPGPSSLSFGERLARAWLLGHRAFGLPLLLLAIAGIPLAIRSRRDTVTLALTAWTATMVLFLAFRTVAPVDPRLQRYADEFIERVYYLTLPAVALLAAGGVVSTWGRGVIGRALGSTLLAIACAMAVQAWFAWFR